jgi:hypothetical protein
MSEIREIVWQYVSPKEQSHQMCRYCQRTATHMRKQKVGKAKNPQWVALCVDHAKIKIQAK